MSVTTVLVNRNGTQPAIKEPVNAPANQSTDAHNSHTPRSRFLVYRTTNMGDGNKNNTSFSETGEAGVGLSGSGNTGLGGSTAVGGFWFCFSLFSHFWGAGVGNILWFFPSLQGGRWTESHPGSSAWGRFSFSAFLLFSVSRQRHCTAYKIRSSSTSLTQRI